MDYDPVKSGDARPLTEPYDPVKSGDAKHAAAPYDPVTAGDAKPDTSLSNDELRAQFEEQEAKGVGQRVQELPGHVLEGIKSAAEPFLQTPAEMGEASANPEFGRRVLSTITHGKVKAIRGLADFATGALTHGYEDAVDHPVASVIKGLGAPVRMTMDALDYLGKNPLQDKEQRWRDYQLKHFRKLADAENANAPATPLERFVTTAVEPFSNIAEQANGGEVAPLPHSAEALSTVLQLAGPELAAGASAKVAKGVNALVNTSKIDRAVANVAKAVQGGGKLATAAGELPQTLSKAVVGSILGEGAGTAAENTVKSLGQQVVPLAVSGAASPIIATARALVKGGEVATGAGELAEALANAPANSIQGRAHQVMTREGSPEWMKSLLGKPFSKGVAQVAGIGKDLAKGAVGGAGVGLAYGALTGQTPEEMAESAGGGASLGFGVHGSKIVGTRNRAVLQRAAGASAELFKQHLQDGVAAETLKSVPDSAWTMAAALQQYPGMNAVKVRFVSPEAFADLKTHDGSPLTDPGAAGVWDRSRQTIWLNAESKRGVDATLLHEAAHPIFDAAVLQQPELGRAIEAGLTEKGQNIEQVKRAYIETLMAKELPGMDLQTREAKINNRIAAFDAAFPGNSWIYSEVLAENFVNSFGTKDVLNLDPTIADVMRSAVKNIFGGQENVKGFFTDYANVVQSPELTKLSRGLLKAMRDHRPGVDVLGGEAKETPLTPEMFGKRPEAPLHDIVKPDGTIERGNDFVVASPDGIRARAVSAMRRIIKDRVAAVRSLFDTKTVLPLGSDNTTVALRRTRNGGEEISGKVMPTSFDSLSVYNNDTKNMVKVIQDAINTGKTLGSYVHQVASGTLKKTWAAIARSTKGAFTAKYHDYQPYGWLIDKQGNVLVRVFDRQALDAKLADWATRKGLLSLEQWGGDSGKAMADVQTYLDNHSKGLKGEENGIGPDKANTINALLTGRNAEFADKNPLRDQLKGGDRQGIIRSLRLDRIETMEPSRKADLPVPQYGKLVENFSPEADNLVKMSPEDYHAFVSNFKGPHGGGQSGWSFDLGSKVKSVEELNHLRELHAQMREQFKAAMSKGDMNGASIWASKSQAMREAYEAATSETLDGKPSSTEKFVQQINPEFKSPMAAKSPEGTASAMVNSAAESVKAIQQFSPDKKEKPHAVGGTIPVLHFSDSPKPLKTVDPKFMRMDAVGKYWEPKPHRSFFFVQGSALEEHNTKFANRDAYVANIDGRKIYDATGKDPLGFFDTWPIAREKQILDAGYKGILISANGGKDKVIISYEPVKVKPSTEKTGTGSFSPDEVGPADEAGTTTPAQVKRAATLWRTKGVQSPFFKRWFKGSKVVDDEGQPMEVHHGTTHKFDAFDISKPTEESDMGAGHYFTESFSDANSNYVGVGHDEGTGPDLKNRIERVAEDIRDNSPVEMSIEEAEAKAREELVGKDPHVITAYLNIKNPVVFDLSGPEQERSHGWSKERAPGPKSTKIDLNDELKSALMTSADLHGVYKPERLWESLVDNAGEDYSEDGTPQVDAYKLKRVLVENADSPAIIRDVFQRMGYDGIIYENAGDHFPFMNIGSAKHFVVWDAEQVKSKDNRGTFSKTDPRMAFSPDIEQKNTVDSKPEVSEDTGMSKKFAGYGSRITSILKDKAEKKPVSLGVTFSVARGREVKTGFSASPFPDMSLPVEPNDFNNQVITDFIQKHLPLLKNPETALGIWDDSKGDSKKIWLDIVTTTANKAFAEYLGKKYNQYGIGNLDEYVAGRDGFVSTGGNGEAPKDMTPASERLNTDTKAFEASIHEPIIKGTVTPGVPQAGERGRMRSPEEANKLSMEHVLDSPDMLDYAKAVVEHFKTVPGFRDISAKDPHAALKEISSRIQENLEFWYDKASPEEREQWRQWYDIANHMSKKWGQDYGKDMHVVAAINAKFSPQTAWNDNVTLTRTFLETMKEDPAVTEADKKTLQAVMKARASKKNARSPEENKALIASVDSIKVGQKVSELNDLQAGMIVRVHNELKGPLLEHDHNLEPMGGDTGWNTDWPTLEGMVSVYRNPSRVNVDKWLGKNHKVRSFYNNHVAPESPNWTTVDTHAIAAGIMLPVGSVDNEVKKGFGGISHKGSGYKGTYFVYQDAYEKAAAKLGILPRELQSIVWEKARQALTPARKRALQDDMSSIKQVHKLREAGRMTPEQSRQAVLDIYKEKQPEEKSNEPEQQADEPF